MSREAEIDAVAVARRKHVSLSDKQSAVHSILWSAEERGGMFDTGLVQTWAAYLGVAESSVWRWVRDPRLVAKKPVRKGRPRRLPDDLWAEVASWGGSLDKAYAALKERGEYRMSRASFYRDAAASFPALQAGIRKGRKEMYKNMSFASINVTQKQQILAYDHTKLDIRVWVPEKNMVMRPWCTPVLDYATRFCQAFVLSYGDWDVDGNPTSEVVVAALGMAIAGAEYDGVFVGGVPALIRADNGAENKSKMVEEGIARLGVGEPSYTFPYSPWGNGRAEAFHRTVKGWIADLPGYTKLPTVEGGDNRTSDVMDRETFERFLSDKIREYNMVRPHTQLNGMTPLEAWKADPTEVRRASPAVVRTAMMREATGRVLSSRGITFRGGLYKHDDDARGRIGGECKVRYWPNNPSSIEVYQDGEWLCTAYLSSQQPEYLKNKTVAIRETWVENIISIEKTGHSRRKNRNERIAANTSGAPLPDIAPVETEHFTTGRFHADAGTSDDWDDL